MHETLFGQQRHDTAIQFEQKDPFDRRYGIRIGSKEVQIELLKSPAGAYWEACTILSTTDAIREPHETTNIYRKVDQILKKNADDLQLPIHYSLDTQHPTMVAWAQTKGKEAFDWDHETSVGDHFTFSKKYIPRHI